MYALKIAGVNIKYEVKDLVRTIDFYNILLGEIISDLYPNRAVYYVKNLLLTLTFIQNPKTMQPVCGHFSLLFKSDEEVYNRFREFTKRGFIKTAKINPETFTAENHSFSIKDPDGITWELSTENKEKPPHKLFNIPQVNSVWDILKPL